MSLEYKIKSEREAIEQMELSDNLREKVSNVLTLVDETEFYRMNESKFKLISLKLVKKLTEDTKSIEALEAAKRIVNYFGPRNDFEDYVNKVSLVSRYEDGKLLSSVAEVLEISAKLMVGSRVQTLLALEKLSSEENNFSKEYLNGFVDVVKCLCKADERLAIRNFCDVINDTFESNLSSCHDDLKTIIDFHQAILGWGIQDTVIQKVNLTYTLFRGSDFTEERKNFLQALDLYNNDHQLIKEIYVKNFEYHKKKTDFRKGMAFGKFFTAITLPEISKILKSDEVEHKIPILMFLIRETCFLIPKHDFTKEDFGIVTSIINKAYDFVVEGKDLYLLQKQVDYSRKNAIFGDNFNYLTSIIEQAERMDKEEIEEFLYYNGKLSTNIDDKDLCDSLSRRSKNNLVNAYHSVVKVSQKWRGKYRSSAKEAFFDVLNDKVSYGNSLLEKEKILNEYSRNVVRLVNEKIIDLAMMQEVAA